MIPFIAVILVALVCWNWWLEARTLVSMAFFFGSLFCAFFTLPCDSNSNKM